MKTVICCIVLLVLFHAHAIAGDAWTYITEFDGQEIGYVLSMASEADGTIWVSSNRGVFRYKDSVWSDEKAHFKDGDFTGIVNVTVSPNGNVWFCHSNSLIKYDGNNWSYYNYTDSTIELSGLSVDSKENVWCTTKSDSGLLKFDGKEWKILQANGGIVRNSVSGIKVSPEDDVWIRYGDQFITEKSAGIPPVNFGVSRFNGAKWITYTVENGLISNTIGDITFSPDALTYISCGDWGNEGILRFNGSKWETISKTLNGKIEFGRDGTLWVIFRLNSLYRYNGISFEYCPKPPEIPTFTQTMCFDADNNIWLGVYGGVVKFDISTGVHQNYNLKPQDFVLHNAFPNPFNPSTTLTYSLAKPANVSLAVFDSSGRKIATLVDNFVSAGEHSVQFDGNGLSSGVYFYRLKAGGVEKSGRMTLVR
jgi:hypothetical protein